MDEGERKEKKRKQAEGEIFVHKNILILWAVKIRNLAGAKYAFRFLFQLLCTTRERSARIQLIGY